MHRAKAARASACVMQDFDAYEGDADNAIATTINVTRIGLSHS
jgi:hypothetical protein